MAKLDFPDTPLDGSTHTNPETGTVYTYEGTHPDGFWSVLRAGTVSQATKSDVDAGTNQLKYVSPYAMSDVKDTANDALSRTNGGDIEALINPKAGVKGRTSAPKAGEIGEFVNFTEHDLFPAAPAQTVPSTIMQGEPLISPNSAGVWLYTGSFYSNSNGLTIPSGSMHRMFLNDINIFQWTNLSPTAGSGAYAMTERFSLYLGYLDANTAIPTGSWVYNGFIIPAGTYQFSYYGGFLRVA